jgi:hypothetical protein
MTCQGAQIHTGLAREAIGSAAHRSVRWRPILAARSLHAISLGTRRAVITLSTSAVFRAKMPEIAHFHTGNCPRTSKMAQMYTGLPRARAPRSPIFIHVSHGLGPGYFPIFIQVCASQVRAIAPIHPCHWNKGRSRAHIHTGNPGSITKTYPIFIHVKVRLQTRPAFVISP